MINKPIVAIDFDETIVDNGFPNIENATLKSGARECINKLYLDGCYIIIWTCRTGKYLEDARKFLDDNKIPYDKINTNSVEMDFDTSDKIYYDYLIDDKCSLEPINWQLNDDPYYLYKLARVKSFRINGISDHDMRDLRIKVYRNLSMHYDRVRKLFNKLSDNYTELMLVNESLTIQDLELARENIRMHDILKFSKDELLSTFYRYNKDEINKIDPKLLPTNIKELIRNTIEDHVLKSNHHPEYWDKLLLNKHFLDPNDTSKSSVLINAVNMPNYCILEMCCDWKSASEMHGNSVMDWAVSTINKRWKFSDEQVKLIYDVLGVLVA